MPWINIYVAECQWSVIKSIQLNKKRYQQLTKWCIVYNYGFVYFLLWNALSKVFVALNKVCLPVKELGTPAVMTTLTMLASYEMGG
jgi:hypothetical protein